MEKHERDFFIARVQAGYIRCKIGDLILIVKPPTHDVEYEACEVYNSIYNDALIFGLPQEEDTLQLLVDRGLWTDEMEKAYKVLPEDIDKLKIELYRASLKSTTRERTRKYLTVAKTELNRLIGIRESLHSYTCHGLAAYTKWSFIIENSVYYIDRRKYDWNGPSINAIMAIYNEQILSQEQVRELARTDPWMNIWSIKKQNHFIFPEPWSLEQKSLISWSLMYDNVYGAHDCPHDSIIQDDDMLDGWLCLKRKEREEQQNKKMGDEAFAQNKKIAEAGEIFVPVETPQDAAKVYEKNDFYGRSVVKSRFKQIEEKGTVHEMELADVKQRYFTEAQQALSEHYRNRK